MLRKKSESYYLINKQTMEIKMINKISLVFLSFYSNLMCCCQLGTIVSVLCRFPLFVNENLWCL